MLTLPLSPPFSGPVACWPGQLHALVQEQEEAIRQQQPQASLVGAPREGGEGDRSMQGKDTGD